VATVGVADGVVRGADEGGATVTGTGCGCICCGCGNPIKCVPG